jgi:hypothetical protein
MLARTLHKNVPIPFGTDIWYGATPPGAVVDYMPYVPIPHTAEQLDVTLPRVFGADHPYVEPLRMALSGYAYDAAFFMIADEALYPGTTPSAIWRSLAAQVRIWVHPDKERCNHDGGRAFLAAAAGLKTALDHIEELIRLEQLGSTCRRNAKAL